MLCNYCDTPNPEGAMYCKHCGRRLDGMALCSFCGKLTPADGDFCVNCGANRNAPVYLMKERALSAESQRPARKGEEGVYPVGRGDQKAVNDAARLSERRVPAERSSKRKGIFSLVSHICGSISALMALIFVFLIGMQLSVGSGGVSAGSGIGGYDIFYFFGEAYKSGALTDSENVIENVIGPVCGTVASVLALGGTAACFVVTLVRYIKILRKRTQKSLLPCSAATFAAYIAGVALFGLCAAQSSEIVGVSTSMTLNGATVAGIVICAVLLVASAVFSALAEGVPCVVRKYVLHTVTKGCSAVFAFVALALIGSGVVFVKLTSVDGGNTYGIYALFNALMSAGTASGEEFASTYNGCLVLSVVTILAAVAAGVFTILSLYKNYSSWSAECTKKGNIFGIVGGVCAIVSGVGACVCSSLYAKYLGETYAADLLVPIFVIGFGLLVCAAAVVNMALSKKMTAEEE